MLAVLLAFPGSGNVFGGLLSLAAALAWFTPMLAIRPLLARFAGAGDQTFLIVRCSLSILSACLSEALGTRFLIRAFIAGAIMPATSRTPLLGRLELVTATVLLPFFFVATGLRADIGPGSLSFLGLLAVSVGATVAGKLAGAAVTARGAGFS